MVGWHHRLERDSVSLSKLGDAGQLACCSPRGCSEVNMTEPTEQQWASGAGFSCYGAQAHGPWAAEAAVPRLRAQAQWRRRTGLVGLPHVGSSQTRDRPCVPCRDCKVASQPLDHQVSPQGGFLMVQQLLALILSSDQPCRERRTLGPGRGPWPPLSPSFLQLAHLAAPGPMRFSGESSCPERFVV